MEVLNETVQEGGEKKPLGNGQDKPIAETGHDENKDTGVVLKHFILPYYYQQ